MIGLFEKAATDLVPFLLVITLIVTVHEAGHFMAARAFGVSVDRFSIGFGRAIAAWRDRAGTEWRIAWLPLGGYVRFAGDDNIASVPDQTDLAQMRAAIIAAEGPGAERKYLHFKPVWQRALVVAAGPVANFLLAILLFAVFFAVFGLQVTSTRVFEVMPGSPAQQAGFQAGDRLTSADGHPVRSFEDLQFYVQFRQGVPIDIGLDRAGRPLHLIVRPEAVRESSPFGGSQLVGRLGLLARGGRTVRVDPAQAVELGVRKTWEVTSTTVYYLGRILSGQVSPLQLHSFVGMLHASGAVTHRAEIVAQQEQVSFVFAAAFFLLQLAAFISVSVGLLNLLPVPVLDGGHLLFYAYEGVARRPLAAGVQAAGYRAGLALLVGLMLFATFNDLRQLRLFHSLFGSLFS
ncbi:MAG TPA: RIP metalloprotease [Caulobacteraceae bacterium]|nr:RIP metalloprotease [Caulobacteraceae bacterium]